MSISISGIEMRNFIWIIIFFVSFSCARYNSQIVSSIRIIDNVPFYPQLEYQCGPATLASVLNYHGDNLTPEEIAKEIFSISAKGTLTFDMIKYVKARGFKADNYRGSLNDIKVNINNGKPLIVLVDYGFLFYQQNHFMVIIGYNDYGVIVNSDSKGMQLIDNESFMKIWEKANFWTLLIEKNS